MGSCSSKHKRRETGASIPEYVLLVALLSLFGIGMLQALGAGSSQSFQAVQLALNNDEYSIAARGGGTEFTHEWCDPAVGRPTWVNGVLEHWPCFPEEESTERRDLDAKSANLSASDRLIRRRP